MTAFSIERAVAAALTASPEVAALVSGRVYPLKLPQGAVLPAITYQRTYSSPEYTLQGYGSESVTLTLNSFGPAYEEAKELAMAVRGVMTVAPFKAMVRKEVDLTDETIEDPCVSTEYLVQQRGGQYHG